MKFGWKNYWDPTPKNIRKIADSLLASATVISTFAFYTDYKTLAMTVMIVSALAKFVSNFFTDDAQDPQQN